MPHPSIVILLTLVCVPAVAWPDEPSKTVPIPDENVWKSSDKLVKAVFGEEIEAAKTPEKQAALVKKLLQEASRPDQSAGSRYALLKNAHDNAPDATSAVSIVDEMTKHFQIDPLKTKASTLWRMSQRSKTAAQHTAVADVGLQLVDESVKRDAYDYAITLAKIASDAAGQVRGRAGARLVQQVQPKTKDLPEVVDAWKVLAATPMDAQANLTVGTYKCFVWGDWQRGIPMLALGSDEALKALAARELKAANTSDVQLALADGWYELAQKEDEPKKERMRQRAAYWYQLSLTANPALSRLVTLKVENRLADLKPIIPINTDEPPRPSLDGYGCRSAGNRAAAVRQGGGNAATEAAVEAALKWLADHQNGDGSWSWAHTPGDKCSGYDNPGSKKSKMGATGMALSAFLGAGYTHENNKYEDVVQKGLSYLVGNMIVRNDMGKLFEENGEGHEHMYCHGIAACALVEAYGMTKDRKLKKPAQLGINYIVAAQHPENGGWLYQPRQGGDTSVSSWQIMALKSAMLAQIKIPSHVKDLANRWLDSVQYNLSPGSRIGSHYGYRKPADQQKKGMASTSCSAIGLLCRMYLGTKKDDPGLQAGVQAVAQNGPGSQVYFNYYAAMLMYQADGPDGEMWEAWNVKMRDLLVHSQVEQGKDKGSWYLGGGQAGQAGGRVYHTAMCAMTLEVYYRYPQIANH